METTDERRRIGKRIAELRYISGLSQVQLAEKSGVNASQLAKIELGMNSTGVDVLSRIVRAMGYRIDFVLDE